jgi:hypothetical protein
MAQEMAKKLLITFLGKKYKLVENKFDFEK